MKNICFINASPKGKKSNSMIFLSTIDEKLKGADYNKSYIHVTQSIHSGKTEEDFKTMSKAEVIVLCFPLYVYSLPGVLMRFLEDYYSYVKRNNISTKDTRVYAVVNCGFPEPVINNEAIRIVKNFCTRLDLNWRFAVSISMGEMVGATKDIKFMRKMCSKIYSSLEEIGKDIENHVETPIENKYAVPRLPVLLFYKIGSANWRKAAKDNGLSEEDLYKKPLIG